MEAILLVLFLAFMYELVKPRSAPEKTPEEKIRDAIRAKEDGKLSADEFFVKTRETLILDQ